MEKFWKQQDWLDKTKETDEDFYNKIINGKVIEIDWNTFSLVIDGTNNELKLGTGKQEIKIINENGNENTTIR